MDHAKECALKADPAAQLRLLDLQAEDSRLDQVAHRRATLPEVAELAQLHHRLAQVEDELVAVETEDSDLAREQTKVEAEVDQVRARAERDQRRLDAGQVGSPRELESLQHEIGSLARRQSDLEDAVLAVMERREATQARRAALQADRERLQAEAADVEARRAAATADLDAAEREAADRRAELAAGVPEDLLGLYEKLRAQYGGVGAAALRRRRCEGCRLELNTTELARLAAAPPEEVSRCEECRRILVRTPESGL